MKYRDNPFGENNIRRWVKITFLYFSIWLPFLVILILDVLIEIYHRLSFWMYKVDYIKRSDYIIIDRHRLKYLNFFERVNCAYCGYVNGVFKYWSKIALVTESFWCGIKHQKYNSQIPEEHKEYYEYSDVETLNREHPPN